MTVPDEKCGNLLNFSGWDVSSVNVNWLMVVQEKQDDDQNHAEMSDGSESFDLLVELDEQ